MDSAIKCDLKQQNRDETARIAWIYQRGWGVSSETWEWLTTRTRFSPRNKQGLTWFKQATDGSRTLQSGWSSFQTPKRNDIHGLVISLSISQLSQVFEYWKFLTYMGGSIVMGVPENGYFMENPSKMDDLGVPLFQETTIWLILFRILWCCGGMLWFSDSGSLENSFLGRNMEYTRSIPEHVASQFFWQSIHQLVQPNFFSPRYFEST